MKSKIYIMAHKIRQKDQLKVGPIKFSAMNLQFFPPFLTQSWHISSLLILSAKANAYSNVGSMHLLIPLPGSLCLCWFSSGSDLSSNVPSPPRASLPHSPTLQALSQQLFYAEGSRETGSLSQNGAQICSFKCHSKYWHILQP